MRHIQLLICVLLFGEIIEVQAQEAVLTTGGDASSSQGSVSYSIGQVAYTWYYGLSASEAQGVQQPYEISEMSIPDTTDNDLIISLYPNPTPDIIILTIEGDLSDLFYQLYDDIGKLIFENEILDRETSIIMEKLVRAVYFLRIVRGDKELKTFKIIKHP